MTRDEKARQFKALHERGAPFIIPNPFDKGTARILEGLGFEALATTSAGAAYAAGKVDNQVGRDAMIAHVAEVVSATDLPVSADLENGFADAPEGVAETIRLGLEAGLAGGSIEDMGADRTLYDLPLAVERIQAAAEVAHGDQGPFVLTARAENYLVGDRTLSHVIERLQAYQEAGADVLYAPGLTDLDDIKELTRSVDRPVNVLMGLPGVPLTLADAATAGVARVSTGSTLAVAAYGAFIEAAKELQDSGTFTYSGDGSAFGAVHTLLS